jgi:acyl dehydratase
MTDASAPIQLGRGLCWQDLAVGQRFRTQGRTVTEADLVNFISVTGMLETIFTDVTHGGGAMGGRPVPAALTQGLIEGLQMQTLIQGVGLALLEINTRALAPTRVGDTVFALVEVVEVKPTSKGNRAVVTTHVDVLNQSGETVLAYDVKRLIAGDPARG